MYIWLGITLALAFSGLIESLLGFNIPFLALRSMILFLLVLGMSYTYYREEQATKRRKEIPPQDSEAVKEEAVEE